MKKNKKFISDSNKVTKSQVKNMLVSASRKLPLKSKDTVWTLSATTAGTFGTILFPAVGTANGQRTGDEIELVKIDLRMYDVYGDPVNIVRFILFQWVPPSGAVVTSDILSNGPTGFPDVMSHYIPFAKNKEFRILLDQTTCLDQTGSNGIVAFNKVLKPIIKKIPFTAGTTTALTGQIYFLVISDSGVVIHPANTGAIRIWYRDV